MKVILKLTLNGNVKERALKLNEMVSIGRSSKADFKLEDTQISGLHCRFYLKHDRLELTDLDSKNGTYLNGIRVEKSEVFVGDKVRIGDTSITLEDESFDQEALQLLTFPGPHKERLDYELKMDFTGARIQNQEANKRLSIQPKIKYDRAHAREINARKKINSGLRLSKEEIREQNKFTSLLSSLLDLVFMFLILTVPFMFKRHIKADKDTAFLILLGIELVVAVVFMIWNYRGSKFTLGERVSGIKELYDKQ